MSPDKPDRELLLFSGLIEAFERLGVRVEFAGLSFEGVKGKGGLCRVHGEHKIIIEKGLSIEEKNELLAAELARLDVEGLYLPPIVREAVEHYMKIAD